MTTPFLFPMSHFSYCVLWQKIVNVISLPGLGRCHRFYQKQYLLGILYLAVCWSGYSVAMSLIDLLIIIPKTPDENGDILMWIFYRNTVNMTVFLFSFLQFYHFSENLRFYAVFKWNHFSSIWKAPPIGAVDFMIFGLENHKIPSHYDLHMKNFNPSA